MRRSLNEAPPFSVALSLGCWAALVFFFALSPFFPRLVGQARFVHMTAGAGEALPPRKQTPHAVSGSGD